MNSHSGLFNLLTIPGGSMVKMVGISQVIVISNSRNIGSNSLNFLKIKKGLQVLPFFFFEVPDVLRKDKALNQSYKNCDVF